MHSRHPSYWLPATAFRSLHVQQISIGAVPTIEFLPFLSDYRIPPSLPTKKIVSSILIRNWHKHISLLKKQLHSGAPNWYGAGRRNCCEDKDLLCTFHIQCKSYLIILQKSLNFGYCCKKKSFKQAELKAIPAFQNIVKYGLPVGRPKARHV